MIRRALLTLTAAAGVAVVVPQTAGAATGPSAVPSHPAAVAVTGKCFPNEDIGLAVYPEWLHPSTRDTDDWVYANDNTVDGGYLPNTSLDDADVCYLDEPAPQGRVWSICFHHVVFPAGTGGECGNASDQVNITSGPFAQGVEANRPNWQNWETFRVGCDPIGYGEYIRRVSPTGQGLNFWRDTDPAGYPGLNGLVTVTATNLNDGGSTSFIFRDHSLHAQIGTFLRCPRP